MRTCLGAVMTLSPDEISSADFAGARVVHIEGYVLFNRALGTKVIESARAAGCRISLSLASFEMVASASDWLLAEMKKGLGMIFANEDEARTLFPELPTRTPEDYAAHVQRLAAFGGTAAVTLGKSGAWVASGSELHRIAPVAVADAVDTNGAGDAWAAGFLSGWLRGKPLAECGRLGSIVAAETVRHIGPIIPDSAWPSVAAQARNSTVT